MFLKKNFSFVLLTVLLLSPVQTVPPYALAQSQPAQTFHLPVVDGIFQKADMENRMLFVALDKDGKIVQEINFSTIESVYLIQGKTEKLKEYLVGGTVGGAVGFSSLFLDKLVSLIKDNKNPSDTGDDKNGGRFNWIRVAALIGGGAGAGMLVQRLKNGGEDVRDFPVYDPKIKQDNPNYSMNFSDIANLKTKLTEKESFVHITLREAQK